MRPILVGLRNPHSKDPRDALSPVFPGSTGARIFSMIASRRKIEVDDYLRAFDRRNIDDGPKSPHKFVDSIPVGSVVVLLGEDVRKFVWAAIPLPKYFLHPVYMNGLVWRQVPHPSGRNLFYNDEVARELVSVLFEDLYLMSTGELK